MPGDNSDVAAAATRFHEDIPHRFQVSLTMSMDTRDSLRAVRDAINEECDDRVFTTDDVIRLALQGTADYHALASGEQPDEEAVRPLAAVVGEVLDADEARATDQPSE